MFFAYLDPFTGSLILQILAASFVSVMAFFKPILRFFKGSKSNSDSTLDDWNETNESEDPEKQEPTK